MHKNIRLIMTVAFLGFLLAACGGSGGSAGTTPTTPTTPTDPTNPTTPSTPAPPTNLLFKSGSISMVDPDNLATLPVVLESGNTLGELGLVGGTVETASQQITDRHIRTVIYANTDDGKLYRISALKSDPQPPFPIQVSSETQADKICTGGQFLGHDTTLAVSKSDYFDHNQSVYFYELPGTSGTCGFLGSNTWKMVRLSMSNAESPIPAKQPVEALYDKTTGEINGFLAKEGPKLVRCDLDFGVCSDVIVSTVGTFFINVVVLASDPFTGHIILEVDGTLYSYNVLGNILSSPLHALNTTTFQSKADGSHFYFSDGGQILKVPMDGSVPPVSIATESASVFRLELTANRVVYQTVAGIFPIEHKLKSVSKSGGVIISLASSSTDTTRFLLFGVAGNLVYYDETKLPISESSVIRDDGTGKTTLSNSFFAGPSTFSLSGKPVPLTKIIRAENCVGLTCDLKSYDAATNSGEIVLGSSDFKPTFSGFGNNLLGFDLDAGLKSDIFFVNLNKAGSLKKITTTTSISELTIPISD